MTRDEKTLMNAQNIRTALKDYGRHTRQPEVLGHVSDRFIYRLAEDNYDAKEELRNLFRKSPVWNEDLDAIVINGNRTHDPNYQRIEDLIWIILRPVDSGKIGWDAYDSLEKAVCLFTNPDPTDEEREKYIKALKSIAPKAYSPTKKLSRVFRSLCDALGVTDDTKGSDFQKYYAQFADELSTRQIDYKLYVSVNPAHFITMSNPIDDRRGSTLTSCHSFNRTDYEYNNGCSGYARDPYTFIVFTAADPYDSETLNNRKTSRQIFSYKPGNGLLLQSRLYNTDGGTTGAQALSKDYRDLIQRELSAIEDSPNLWRTFKYYGQHDVVFEENSGFGGYADWTYRDFDAKVSIRADHEDDYETWEIGEYGLCIECGCETSNGLFCEDCDHYGKVQCDDCGEWIPEEEVCMVYYSCGDQFYVCEHCRDRNYAYCDECGEYYYEDNVRYVDSTGHYVCDDCLESNYFQCDECGEYFRERDENTAVDAYGYSVSVCDSCLENNYLVCDECGENIHEDYAVFDDAGNSLCPSCLENRKAQECENEESEESAA